jgi:ribulose-phosphate 3-epimerase
LKREIKISPSLLSADFGNLEAEIAQIDPSLVHSLHVDVMDGHFVPNLTIGPLVVKAIRSRTALPLDVHLMIESPEKYLKNFIDAGASYLTIHVEATHHPQRCLQEIRQRGAKAGISLNPATPLNQIEHLLPDLDLILLMTVNPGFGGQSFIPQMIQKISDCRNMIGKYPIELEVDGGIKLQNIGEVYDAGAEVFVSGSEIFENAPYNEMIRRMKSVRS